jgi:metal-responsive CopG/Arc/MetJ family transcriptional regulator
MKKILVALPKEVVDLIDNELKGKLGDGHSDIIRTITMNWLSEKGYLSKGGENGKK